MTGLLGRHPLDAILAGEDTAASLGLDVDRFRTLVFTLAALATAALVALAGVIGFVGLMVGGDLPSRVCLAPQDLPVGIVTAAAGGAFVLVLELRPPRGD